MPDEIRRPQALYPWLQAIEGRVSAEFVSGGILRIKVALLGEVVEFNFLMGSGPAPFEKSTLDRINDFLTSHSRLERIAILALSLEV